MRKLSVSFAGPRLTLNMQQDYSHNFMVVDDDPINNRFCSFIIGKLFPSARINRFTLPEEALNAIRTNYTADTKEDTILLLDLNMPVLSGWDVLDEIRQLPEAIQKQFNIYVLTSSIDERDRQKAYSNGLVFGFFEKPLSEKQLESVFLVKKYRNSFLKPVAKSAPEITYPLPDDDRRILDRILPYFQLNETAGISKFIRQAWEKEYIALRNMPVNLHADRISSFLMLNGFANNLSGDPVINNKGMLLKNAGSLKNYEVFESRK